jgi:integrase
MTLGLAGIALPTKFFQNLPNSSIVSYVWQMKKDGLAESTTTNALARLLRLAKSANLDDPEHVKAVLATMPWKNSSKTTIAAIYTRYLKYLGKTWNKPKYTKETALPFIPTEAEIDSLISSACPKTATILQILKETGARIGEIDFLQWQHIDQERRTIYITAEKGSNSRILPISLKLIAMLNQLPKINNKVFQTNKHTHKVTFEALRKRTAIKLNNQRLNNIHMHTFRHWKATMEYHKTKDIMHVKLVLGHKKIDSTMVYINLEQAIFLYNTDEYITKVAHTPEEIIQLNDAGFTYIQSLDGLHFYRKRK